MTMEIPLRDRQRRTSLEDGDGSESDDQDFDDERVQYAPRPSQVRPRIKDSMLTAGLRMRDSAQLQLY
jgi:hypothetical protein